MVFYKQKVWSRQFILPEALVSQSTNKRYNTPHPYMQLSNDNMQ